MGLEVLLAVASHLLQPRFVCAHRGVVGRHGEVGIEECPQRPLPVAQAVIGDAVVDIAPLALFADQAGVLQQAQVPGHAGLGHVQDSGQLADIKAVLRQNPKDAQSGAVSEETEKISNALHVSMNLHRVIGIGQQKCLKCLMFRHFATIRAHGVCGTIAGNRTPRA